MPVSWFFALAGGCGVLAVAAIWLDRIRRIPPKTEELRGESFHLPVIPIREPVNASPDKWALALYRAKPLLSEWERKVMFGISKQIPRDFIMLAQVRYADFVVVDNIGTRFSETAFYKIASKSADLVVMNRWSGKVVLVVELDDDSHNRPDRRVRDDFVAKVMEQVEIPMLRFTPRDHINLASFFEGRPKKDEAGS